MKKFFAAICIFAIVTIIVSCSSRQPREPRPAPAAPNYGKINLKETNTFVRQSANAASASIGAEPMKVWSRPLELGFEVNTNIGQNGHIDEIFPKDEEDILRMTQNETYYKYAKLQDESNHSQTDRTSSGQDLSFNNLPALAQSAILAIIKDYNLDGFYVTMIEEFTGTIESNESTGRTIPIYKYDEKQKQRVQTGTQQEMKKVKKTYKQVRVRGIALKLTTYTPVSEERSDAVRKEEAGAPVNYIYR